MIDEKFGLDTKVYTDIQGLSKLQYGYKNHPDEVKKQVAQQFESIMMQMVLSSMRNANKAFSSGMFGSNQMEFYQDMFDKQLSLSMSTSGNSLASMVEKSIDQMTNGKPVGATPVSLYQTPRKVSESDISQASPPVQKVSQDSKEKFSSPEDFIKKLWSGAKYAANLIGAVPELLLAQAALETNWGKKILQHDSASSTHNLFNIKADKSWTKKSTTVDSLEQKDGILVKEKSNFRSYDSFTDSFMDYVHLLKNNSRYGDSLSKASNPQQFVGALQEAGYATDQNYADKIMKIYSSSSFKNMVTKMKDGT